jgi:hypothetical protein
MAGVVGYWSGRKRTSPYQWSSRASSRSATSPTCPRDVHGGRGVRGGLDPLPQHVSGLHHILGWPGLGQIDYCEQFLLAVVDRAPLPDAIAIHPYLKTPDEAAELFDEYWNLSVRLFGTGIPIVATEWYRPAGQDQIWPFQDMLNNAADGRSTMWNSWFCFSDGMVPGLGLVDGFGNPKPEGYELVSALNGVFLPMQQ